MRGRRDIPPASFILSAPRGNLWGGGAILERAAEESNAHAHAHRTYEDEDVSPITRDEDDHEDEGRATRVEELPSPPRATPIPSAESAGRTSPFVWLLQSSRAAGT